MTNVKDVSKDVSKYVSKNNITRPCLNTLEPSDRVLIRNLSERRGTGKLGNYWKQQVHIIASTVGENTVVYKVKPEHDPKGKLRINWQIKQNSQFANLES